MSPPADSSFYAFGELGRGVLKEIRRETFGEDIGQFSWITADELRGFLGELKLTANAQPLDVACGSGGPALFAAQTVGCRVDRLERKRDRRCARTSRSAWNAGSRPFPMR